MRTFITALILALDQCKVEAPYGFPSDKKSSVTKICRKGYVTEHVLIPKCDPVNILVSP